MQGWMPVLAAWAAILAAPASAAELRAPVHLVTSGGVGAEIGTAQIVDVDSGAKLLLMLRGLPPGEHGLQFMEAGTCDPSSGTPWRPAGAGSDDAPFIFVGADGAATGALILPGASAGELRGRALVLLEHRRDGAAIACGVIG